MSLVDERDIENRFGAKLSRWAYEQGYEVVYLKLSILGWRGWPDRLLIWNDGHLAFIEWKKPGEKPRGNQQMVHTTLRRLGFKVFTYDDDRLALEEVTKMIVDSLEQGNG